MAGRSLEREGRGLRRGWPGEGEGSERGRKEKARGENGRSATEGCLGRYESSSL